MRHRNLRGGTVMHFIDTMRPGARIASPGLLKRAGSVVVDTIRFVAAGCPTVTDAQLEERVLICDGCVLADGKPGWDAGMYGVGGCRQCGCVRWKRNMATTECPLNKWLAV